MNAQTTEHHSQGGRNQGGQEGYAPPPNFSGIEKRTEAERQAIISGLPRFLDLPTALHSHQQGAAVGQQVKA